MKTFVAVLFLIAGVVAIADASPVDKDKTVKLEDVDHGIDTSPDQALNRQRRFTCDVFSFSSSTVTPNHTACALKCVAMGYRGGRCQGTDCICRNDKWI